MWPINCGFRSLKGKASIVNPVNKLYSLAYEVQQTFFVPPKGKRNLPGVRGGNLGRSLPELCFVGDPREDYVVQV